LKVIDTVNATKLTLSVRDVNTDKLIFTARCTSAKRGVAIACRLSVCLSFCLSVCDVSEL